MAAFPELRHTRSHLIKYVVSGFSRTVTVRLKADTTTDNPYFVLGT